MGLVGSPKSVFIKSTQTYHTGKQAGDALAEILRDFTGYNLHLEDQNILLKDSENQTIARSNILTEKVANDGLIVLQKIIDRHDQYRGIIQKKNRAYSWHVEDESGAIILSGSALSRNKRKAEKHWRQYKDRKKIKLESYRPQQTNVKLDCRPNWYIIGHFT